MTTPSPTSIDYVVANTALEGDRVRVTLNQVTDPNAPVVGAAASSISMSLTRDEARSWMAGDAYTMTLTPKPAAPAASAAAPPTEAVATPSVAAGGPVNSSVRDAAAATTG